MSDSQETKIIGLDLLQNPQKKRKSHKNKQPKPNESKPPRSPKSLPPIEIFKLFMTKKIDGFKIPLESFEKSDPFKIHLESCYYHWKNVNPPI